MCPSHLNESYVNVGTFSILLMVNWQLIGYSWIKIEIMCTKTFSFGKYSIKWYFPFIILKLSSLLSAYHAGVEATVHNYYKVSLNVFEWRDPRKGQGLLQCHGSGAGGDWFQITPGL